MSKKSDLYLEAYNLLEEYQELSKDTPPEWIVEELDLLTNMFATLSLRAKGGKTGKYCLPCGQEYQWISRMEEDTPTFPEDVATPQRYLLEGWECPKCLKIINSN